MNTFANAGFRPGRSIGNGMPFRSGGFSSGSFTGSKSLAGPRIGQSYQEWYDRARKAVAAYVELRDRVLPRIADLRAKADIIDWLGSVYLDESPEYRWASVASDISQAKTQGIGIYEADRRTKRITKLEGIVDEFRTKVGEAGALLPPPQDPKTVIIDRDGSPDIGTPIAIGLGALAFAILASAALS